MAVEGIDLKKSAKKLLIIDGTGAMISALMLGIVLVHFESFFGIPSNTLYVLASFPVLFALIDLIAIKNIGFKARFFLRLIAVLNFAYCILSILLTSFHFDKITSWGWLYIGVEIIIIIILAAVELSTAKKLQ